MLSLLFPSLTYFHMWRYLSISKKFCEPTLSNILYLLYPYFLSFFLSPGQKQPNKIALAYLPNIFSSPLQNKPNKHTYILAMHLYLGWYVIWIRFPQVLLVIVSYFFMWFLVSSPRSHFLYQESNHNQWKCTKSFYGDPHFVLKWLNASFNYYSSFQ